MHRVLLKCKTGKLDPKTNLLILNLAIRKRCLLPSPYMVDVTVLSIPLTARQHGRPVV
jgi:hypothetical protein